MDGIFYRGCLHKPVVSYYDSFPVLVVLFLFIVSSSFERTAVQFYLNHHIVQEVSL